LSVLAASFIGTVSLGPITAAAAGAGDITTVAGGGVSDGGPATNAPLAWPEGIAVDTSGNLYIADTENHRIRKVAPTGTITTVAGNGTPGFSGDGGPATQAALNSPQAVAVDASGNVYIADGVRIRKVAPTGTITTVAGNGTAGFSGDGGPATSAPLAWPQGVAVDTSGNLYIADTENHRIRKVAPTGTITTVAGNGTPGFSGDGGPATQANLDRPYGLAVDGAGNLAIADSGNNRIRSVTSAGVITTVAGNGTAGFSGDGGPATEAALYSPGSVAVDSSGNIAIGDWVNNRVRVMSPSGTISTLAGNGIRGFSGDGGPAVDAAIGVPRGLAVDAAGVLYIAGNNRIRSVTPSGVITTVAGNGTPGFSDGGGQATNATLGHPGVADGPVAVAVDGSRNIYVADPSNSRIRKVTASGAISTVAGTGVDGFYEDGSPAGTARINSPRGMAVDASGTLYFAEVNAHQVSKVTAAGVISRVAGGFSGFSGDGGPAAQAALNYPRSVAVDQVGNLYIADTGNHRIRKIAPSGTITTVVGNGTPGFSGDGGPAIQAALNFPMAVAVDQAGNLFIADYLNNRIRKVNQAGVISTVAGTSTPVSGDGGPATSAVLSDPSALAVDTSGNLYIAEYGTNRIRKVNQAGVISTVAGNGTEGFSGDGGPATAAQLARPQGVAIDNAGNLYIADTMNHRVRRVITSSKPTFTLTVTKAGNGAGTVASAVTGIDCGTTCTATFEQNLPVTLTAVPATGSTFTGWSGSGCSGTGTCTVTATAARTVTATFALNTYPLTVTKTGNGAGTIVSSPAGINCGTTCTTPARHGIAITLTALPATGSTFTGWSGACTGTTPCTLTPTETTNVTANFTLKTYTLTVQRAGNGAGTVQSSPTGIDCGAICTTTLTHGMTVTLSATPMPGSTFTGWSGSGCSGTGTCTVPMTAARTVTARFALNTYPLTVTKTGNGAGTIVSSPAGINCGTTCTTAARHGIAITLTAAPATGSNFAGWSGACTGTTPCTLTPTAATNVTATFTLKTYTLTVSSAAAAGSSGKVTSDVGGIDCGSTCTTSLNHGTQVTLTAAAGAGSAFTGWTGACSGSAPTCTVSMTAARSVTARFARSFVLTVTKAGPGSGTVASNPLPINCGSQCSAPFVSGVSVTLTAAATTGSTFSGWSGACTGTAPTCRVSMTVARSVVATFT
jgi:hypothetical protein